MGDKQETLRSRHPKRDEPALVVGMIGIVERLPRQTAMPVNSTEVNRMVVSAIAGAETG